MNQTRPAPVLPVITITIYYDETTRDRHLESVTKHAHEIIEWNDQSMIFTTTPQQAAEVTAAIQENLYIYSWFENKEHQTLDRFATASW